MNPLEALMMPVAEDEQMKALARSLRGRQTAADFFSASSIPNLQKMAQNEQQYIKDVGERQGVLREALERRKQAQTQHEDFMKYRQDELGWRKEDADRDRMLQLTMAALQGGQSDKAPAGYAWVDPNDPNAGLQPIPGGPAEIKIEDVEEKKKLQEDNTEMMMSATQYAINQARDVLTPYSTGLAGSIASKLKRPDRMALEARLDTIKANLSFEALKQIRASNTTGGGLGPVSNFEVGLLGSTVASLSPDMSDKDLADSLNFIEARLKKWGFAGNIEELQYLDQSGAAPEAEPEQPLSAYERFKQENNLE